MDRRNFFLAQNPTSRLARPFSWKLIVLTHFQYHFGLQESVMYFLKLNSLNSQSYCSGKKHNFFTPNHPMWLFFFCGCPALSELWDTTTRPILTQTRKFNHQCPVLHSRISQWSLMCAQTLDLSQGRPPKIRVDIPPNMCTQSYVLFVCVLSGSVKTLGHYNLANSDSNKKIQPPMPRVAFKDILMVPHVCSNTWFVTRPSTKIRVDIPSYVHFVLNKIPEHSLHFFCPKLVRGNYLCGLFPPFACHSTNSFFWTK